MCIHHGVLASKYMVTFGICSIEYGPETICKSLLCIWQWANDRNWPVDISFGFLGQHRRSQKSAESDSYSESYTSEDRPRECASWQRDRIHWSMHKHYWCLFYRYCIYMYITVCTIYNISTTYLCIYISLYKQYLGVYIYIWWKDRHTGRYIDRLIEW